jgi:diketogulonate reductase-like aldo/keto reductase
MCSEHVWIPRLIYGTAWKESETGRLVELALQAGFRGIDTANQRKHYDEAAVGNAIQAATSQGIVTRNDLFLQTKYTFQAGQDHRLPFDPSAPIAEQVQESFASSLQHLKTNYVDSYLLHGPASRTSLTAADLGAWAAMEGIYESGCAKAIGGSNLSFDQLRLLVRNAKVKPKFVQNRCYASTGWDKRVRKLCAAHQIVYQGFSLLTANRSILSHPDVVRISQRYDCSVTQLIFRFAIEIGILPLTGTTNLEHMRSDLESTTMKLDAADVSLIEMIAVR